MIRYAGWFRVAVLAVGLGGTGHAAEMDKVDSEHRIRTGASVEAAPRLKVSVTTVGADERADAAVPSAAAGPGVAGAGRIEDAVEANRARGAAAVREAATIAPDVQGVMDPRDPGALPGTGDSGGRLGVPDPAGSPGREGRNGPEGIGRHGFGTPAGFAIEPTNPGYQRERRADGAALAPPGPRGVGGLASQGGSSSRHTDRHGNRVTYTTVKRHSDGSRTQHNHTYDSRTGEYVGSYRSRTNAEGDVVYTRTTEVTRRAVDYEDNSQTVHVRDTETRQDDGSTVATTGPERELGDEKGDPPATDPNDDVAGYQPADGASGSGFCPGGLYACQREAELARQQRRSPDRVNPGDPDHGNGLAGPRLQIDREALVTNPSPEDARAGGFSPPAGRVGKRKDELEAGPGPGARPPGE